MSRHPQKHLATPPPPAPPMVRPTSALRIGNEKSTTIADSERAWIFHRNREQPTPPINEPVLEQIKFYLDRYKIKEALQLFFDESTLKLLHLESDFMWNIIPLICRRLRGLCQYRFRVFEGCERMLCRIAVDENCNPKEVLISLLAEISQPDQIDDDNVFRAMIRPLEGTLLRMNHPSPREENLRWVLNVLLRHLNSIELPQEYNLEGKKRLGLPNDSSVKRFIEILPLMLSFVEEFNDQPIDFDKLPMPILTQSQIDEVLNGELVDDDLINDTSLARVETFDASVTALLSIMHRPLTFLDLTNYCTDLRIFGNRCLTTLLRVRPNLFSPIYKRICDKRTDLEYSALSCNESTLSLATSSYIYRCERVVLVEVNQPYPVVINHESNLACYMPYIVALLERSEILVHEKGLILLESLLRLLNNDSLGHKFLKLFEDSSLAKQLFQIMVFSPLATNRRRAYDMFTSICDLLTHDCKLKMFKSVLIQKEIRPCVRAACIDQYRKHLTNIYRELIDLHQQLSMISAVRYKKTDDITNQNDTLPNGSPQPYDEYIPRDTIEDEKFIINNTGLQNNNLDDHSGGPTQHRSESMAIIKENILTRMRSLHQKYNHIGGQALTEFLDLCITACLPESQHTDIIENYELLLATLTMFRFLKLRKTIFKDQFEDEYLTGAKLKKSFFDPVRNAIALIMSELKLHHKDIVDGHKSKNSKITQNSILNVTQSRNEFDLLTRIMGSKMEDLVNLKDAQDFNEQDEADCLNWALCRLDLVESVLVRTCDLYNC